MAFNSSFRGLTSWNLLGHSRPVTDCFYDVFIEIWLVVRVDSVKEVNVYSLSTWAEMPRSHGVGRFCAVLQDLRFSERCIRDVALCLRIKRSSVCEVSKTKALRCCWTLGTVYRTTAVPEGSNLQHINVRCRYQYTVAQRSCQCAHSLQLWFSGLWLRVVW